MANKDIVINSAYTPEIKSYALIRCIAHEIEATAARTLKNYGLSETQLSILDALDNSGAAMTVNQIKAAMIDESPNVSRSLNKLMENGLIVKQRDFKDQRVVKIRLTDEGRNRHREADRALLKETAKAALSAEEFDTLYALLQKL